MFLVIFYPSDGLCSLGGSLMAKRGGEKEKEEEEEEEEEIGEGGKKVGMKD